MKERIRYFKDISPFEFILLRKRLGFKRYIKTRKRDEKEWEILLRIYLKKIEEKEKEDFIFIDKRVRKLKL